MLKVLYIIDTLETGGAVTAETGKHQPALTQPPVHGPLELSEALVLTKGESAGQLHQVALAVAE